MSQSRRDQHQRRVAARKDADHPRSSADLADDPLQWVIRFDLSPVIAWERKAGQLLVRLRFDQLRRWQTQRFELDDDLADLVLC